MKPVLEESLLLASDLFCNLQDGGSALVQGLDQPLCRLVAIGQVGAVHSSANAIADVRVVSAFQNDAAHHLQEGHGIECDVLVSGNDKEARAQVIRLVEACGMRGFNAGPIANAAAAEALTSVIININRAFKCHAGISITGIGSGGD